MDSNRVEVGERFAYREYPQRRGSPFMSVEIVEKARTGKWKVRFMDGPNAGLVDFIKSTNIIVPWAEAEGFLEDEKRMHELIEASSAEWKGPDDPVTQAVDTVLRATGEELFFHDGERGAGHLEISVEAARRVLMRTGLEWEPVELDPLGFIDRTGKLHLPFRTSLKLAQAFAAAEPDSVNISVMSEEFRWEEDCRREYRGTTVDLVNKWRAGWALAKKWTKAAAKDHEVQLSLDELRRRVESTFAAMWQKVGGIERQRTTEIQRLRSLLERAAQELKSLGASEKADDLLSEMIGPKRRAAAAGKE